MKQYMYIAITLVISMPILATRSDRDSAARESRLALIDFQRIMFQLNSARESNENPLTIQALETAQDNAQDRLRRACDHEVQVVSRDDS